MNTEQFNQVLEQRISLIRKSLVEKAKEYARDDRLHNFNRLAKLQENPREVSLIHLCDKQYISIHDMIDDLHLHLLTDCQCSEKMSSTDLSLWKEKIGDVINYMILLEAMIEEASLDE